MRSRTARCSLSSARSATASVSHRQGDKAKAIQMLDRAIENDAKLEKAKELLAQIKAG